MTKRSLPEVINRAVSGALRRARVMLPGRIVSFNPATRRADVQPLVMDLLEDESDELVGVPIPVITDVPVVFPGSGGCRLKWPVSAGDTCELVFASSSIARLKVIGNPSSPVNPGDTRRGALPDCVAHLGLEFRAIDADTLIEFTSSEIIAGGTKRLATRDDLLNHTHASFGGAPVEIVASVPPDDPFPGSTKLRG